MSRLTPLRGVFSHLTKNKIISLPTEIGAAPLRSLFTLNLGYNLLSILPREICLLDKLQTLYINDNRLAELPAEFGQLGALEALYADHNKLVHAPAGLMQLQNLRTLWLQANPVSKLDLPSEMAQLRLLANLRVSDGSGGECHGSAVKLFGDQTADGEVAAQRKETLLPYVGSSREEVINREHITRNHEGSEEPHSMVPELWNIDGCELDLKAKYKVGGQLWYLQSRALDAIKAKRPIAGVPLNRKARKAKRKFDGSY